MENFIVKKSITVNANPTQVWDALTNPEKTKKYFFHCKVFSNWKAGSDIIFKGKIFFIKNIELKGTITKIITQNLLQYTLRNTGGDSGSTSTVTDELDYKDGQTTLSITDDVGQGEGAEKRYTRSEKAWDKVLAGLKKLVETEKPDYLAGSFALR